MLQRTGGDLPTSLRLGSPPGLSALPPSPSSTVIHMIVVDPISVPSPGHLAVDAPGPSGFEFDQSTRASHSEQPVPLGGVPRALREAAEMAGLDPVAQLYNEALRYAQEGHLRLARERLQVLLCMAPDDGESRLMLARVHVAGQRWSDALAALDEAQSCGVDVPMSLRRAVEDHLQAEVADGAREQGEVKALRQEARRLRSEHAQVTSRVTDLEKEVRKWAWATAGVSALAIVFVAGSLLLGSGTSTEASVAVAESELPTDAAAATVADAPTEATPTSSGSTLAMRATEALDRVPGLEGSSIAMRIDGERAVLTRQVLSHRQRKAAEKALGQVSGVGSVDAAGLEILARTRGTNHVVGKGDTLSHIAYAYYGESTLTKPIEDANGVDSKTLKIGQDLKIPAVP